MASAEPMGVHLASALALPTAELVVAVWDRRLQDGIIAAGLRMAPAPNMPGQAKT